MNDSTGKQIAVGAEVAVPLPNGTDEWSYEFNGYVDGFHGGYAVVIDGDGDAFCVESERLTIVEE